jgi:hypothetical protein
VITNTGKNILAQYLIGQTQSYASHIAIGIGRRPLAVGQAFPDFSEQEQLEFEVERLPVTSRGFVYDENGNPNIVFLANLARTVPRFEITEVGVYPGLFNPSASNLDSRLLYRFSQAENWEYHTQNASSGIPIIVEPLNQGEVGGEIVVEDVVFITNSNNTLFSSPIRVNLFERPRAFNTTMLVRGDMSFLTPNASSGELELNPSANFYPGSHIHFNEISLNLDANSPDDELRLAFSVLGKKEVPDPESGILETVQDVRILIEFVNVDSPQPTNFARFEVNLNQADSGVDFSVNRYFVIKKKLEDLIVSPNFSWKSVTSARVYATVLEAGNANPSENFYISLDALRFENTTIKNPLYGLTGYSVIKTLDGRPLVKETDAPSALEFRFALGVQ